MLARLFLMLLVKAYTSTWLSALAWSSSESNAIYAPDRPTPALTQQHTATMSFKWHYILHSNDTKFLCIQYYTHTHKFNGPFSRTIRVGRYQKGKTNVDFTEARDSEWQWHHLGICKSAPRSRQITMPAPHHSVFLQTGCPSCHPANSVKALKANCIQYY